MTLDLEPLTRFIGAEVHGVDRDALDRDDTLAADLADALEAHGVLVFRQLFLEPEQQLACCRRIGEIDVSPGHHPLPGIYRVTLDRSKNPNATYLRATFDWHVDGCTPTAGQHPQMATVLSALAVAERGGETEFASTYAAYDALSEDERERAASVRVVHTLEASQRLVTPDPTNEQLARWQSHPASEHPLVWTHRSGRRSLLLGASTDHIVGMARDQGRAVLDELLARATAADRVYRHVWSVGDTVIWDNRGVLHRVNEYDLASPREMLRTTILGDEPIQ